MLIPAGGGPPPHRHDFEEMFHVLDGDVEVTIRGETSKASTGETVNIPALAPRRFRNPTDQPIRLLCLVAPAGLEAYFAEWADTVPTRTSPAPELTAEQVRQRMQKAESSHRNIASRCCDHGCTHATAPFKFGRRQTL